jgi:hypothetical protein
MEIFVMDLLAPTIHLNGTSRKDLEDQLLNARNAIKAAIEAVYVACPHDRDYYVQGREAGATARAQHRDRLRRLMSVQAEYETILERVIS